jgi:hypothetical protein
MPKRFPTKNPNKQPAPMKLQSCAKGREGWTFVPWAIAKLCNEHLALEARCAALETRDKVLTGIMANVPDRLS